MLTTMLSSYCGSRARRLCPPARGAPLLAWLCCALPLSCQSTAKNNPSSAATTAVTAAPAPPPAVIVRGEPLGNSPEVALNELIATPDAFAGKALKTRGTVRRACSTKGCWMQLSAEGNESGRGCRVTFKDYGFFVPTDSPGASALVEGEVQLNVVKPSRVKHYESEGAVFPSKNEDGSANEVRLVATGVELRR